MNFDYGYWGPIIVLAGLIVYGGYMVYKSFKSYMEIVKSKKKYIDNADNDREAFQKESDTVVWVAVYGAVIIMSIIGAIYSFTTGDNVTGVTFCFVAEFSTSLVFEVANKRTIWFGEHYFLYENNYLKYMDAREFTQKGKVFKNYEVRTTNQPEPLKIPHRYGKMLEERCNDFKQKHKRTLRR